MTEYDYVISLGCNCTTAQFLNDMKLRKISCPYDWVVTYDLQTVIETIKTEFFMYYPEDKHVNTYGITLPHIEKSEESKQQTIKRCSRFIDILKSNKKILFVRKSHALLDHGNTKHELKYNESTKNEFEILSELHLFLKTNFPNLFFNLIWIPMCPCYDKKLDEIKSKNDHVFLNDGNFEINDKINIIKLKKHIYDNFGNEVFDTKKISDDELCYLHYYATFDNNTKPNKNNKDYIYASKRYFIVRRLVLFYTKFLGLDFLNHTTDIKKNLDNDDVDFIFDWLKGEKNIRLNENKNFLKNKYIKLENNGFYLLQPFPEDFIVPSDEKIMEIYALQNENNEMSEYFKNIKLSDSESSYYTDTFLSDRSY